MRIDKTTMELEELATNIDDLTDEDFLELFALLAEKHDINIREKNPDGIDKFTSWINDVLHEIRDK